MILGSTYFSIPTYHTSWLHLSEPDLPISLLDAAGIIQFLIDLLKSKVGISLLQISCISLSFIQFSLSLSLSPRTAKSTFRYRKHNDCVSISFPFSTVNWKALLQQILSPTLRQFPGGQDDPTHDLPSVSWGEDDRTVTLQLFGCCWMLRNSGSLLGTRNRGAWQECKSACAPDLCSWRSWRAWAHILCLGLSQPYGQTHSSERARLGCCTDFLQLSW